MVVSCCSSCWGVMCSSFRCRAFISLRLCCVAVLLKFVGVSGNSTRRGLCGLIGEGAGESVVNIIGEDSDMMLWLCSVTLLGVVGMEYVLLSWLTLSFRTQSSSSCDRSLSSCSIEYSEFVVGAVPTLSESSRTRYPGRSSSVSVSYDVRFRCTRSGRVILSSSDSVSYDVRFRCTGFGKVASSSFSIAGFRISVCIVPSHGLRLAPKW